MDGGGRGKSVCVICSPRKYVTAAAVIRLSAIVRVRNDVYYTRCRRRSAVVVFHAGRRLLHRRAILLIIRPLNLPRWETEHEGEKREYIYTQ